MNWQDVRARFPAAERYCYLNTAGAPPISIDAARAGQRYYEEMLAEADLPWDRWLQEVEDVRRQVASFIGADAQDVAFVTNASHGMNLIAEMLPTGDVVTMVDEFPSSTVPWLARGRQLRFVESDERGVIDLGDVEALLGDDVAAVVCSHVQFRTGFRVDLADLAARCHARGIPLVIDAAQSMGAMPIDVARTGIDALVFSGYKWPMAGYGCGALYVARALRASAGVAAAGWMSAREPDRHVNDRLDLKDSAAVVEVGCPSFAPTFALGAALTLLDQIGIERVAGRIHELTDHLHARLADGGYVLASPTDRRQRAGISIVALADAGEIVESLARRGIMVSARGRGVRTSLHVFNLPGDVDRFVDALGDVTGR